MRLVIENEDKGQWNVQNLLKINELTGIPITFDNLHDECNPSPDLPDAFNVCRELWRGKTIPLFHYSEGKVNNKRAHRELPENTPARKFGLDSWLADWEIELKGKEKAIERIEEKDREDQSSVK
jgi:UV DNA damage repair endonuclease